MGPSRYLFCRRLLCGNLAFYGLQEATGLEVLGAVIYRVSQHAIFVLFRATGFRYCSYKGLMVGNPMRAAKGVLPVVVSVGLILAVTAILWQLKLATGGVPHRPVYFYLFPVILIAALYNGRLAVLSTAIAILCAVFFLQDPPYSFANDNPLEYGDLFVFALLAVTTIKFVGVLTRPRASSLAAKRPQSTWKL